VGAQASPSGRAVAQQRAMIFQRRLGRQARRRSTGRRAASESSPRGFARQPVPRRAARREPAAPLRCTPLASNCAPKLI
jgi:hypothetical protein